MPITEELKTTQELRDAGLSQRAAEVLAARLEAAAQASHDAVLRAFQVEVRQLRADLMAQLAGQKAELAAQLAGQKAELAAQLAGQKAELAAQLAGQKAEFEKSPRTMQATLLTAILGAATIVVAVLVALKLF